MLLGLSVDVIQPAVPVDVYLDKGEERVGEITRPWPRNSQFLFTIVTIMLTLTISATSYSVAANDSQHRPAHHRRHTMSGLRQV